MTTINPTTVASVRPAAPSLAARVAVVVGFALQAGAGVLVAASGLMMPLWAIVALGLVWVAGLVVQIRQRRRPLVVLAVPVAIAAIWLLTGTLGEAFLGWTA
jgi:hypothetical protein